MLLVNTPYVQIQDAKTSKGKGLQSKNKLRVPARAQGGNRWGTPHASLIVPMGSQSECSTLVDLDVNPFEMDDSSELEHIEESAVDDYRLTADNSAWTAAARSTQGVLGLGRIKIPKALRARRATTAVHGGPAQMLDPENSAWM